MVPTFIPAVLEAAAALGPIDRHILSHRGMAEWHGRTPRTLQAIATEMRITRERVRQLEQRAWRRALAGAVLLIAPRA